MGISMKKENNLLFDYCISNNVAILFNTKNELWIICSLFGASLIYDKIIFDSGIITFKLNEFSNEICFDACHLITPSFVRNYVILHPQEFFRLAMDSAPSLVNF